MLKKIIQIIKEGDFYLLSLSLMFIIAGSYVILEHKSADEPLINLVLGIIFLLLGIIILWKSFIKKFFG